MEVLDSRMDLQQWTFNCMEKFAETTIDNGERTRKEVRMEKSRSFKISSNPYKGKEVKMKMKGFRLTLALVICLPLMVFLSTSAFSASFDDLEVGAQAPDFTLKDLAEKEITLSEQKGTVGVIQFGSSTTEPFLQQLKAMNKVMKKYRKKAFYYTVYTAEQNYGWQAKDYFAKYERAKGLRFQYGVQSGSRMVGKILVDDVDEAVYKAYGSVPAGVFIVDGEGNVVYKAKVVDPSAVKKAMSKLVK
jgi:peroxiredoxin